MPSKLCQMFDLLPSAPHERWQKAPLKFGWQPIHIGSNASEMVSWAPYMTVQSKNVDGVNRHENENATLKGFSDIKVWEQVHSSYNCCSNCHAGDCWKAEFGNALNWALPQSIVIRCVYGYIQALGGYKNHWILYVGLLSTKLCKSELGWRSKG